MYVKSVITEKKKNLYHPQYFLKTAGEAQARDRELTRTESDGELDMPAGQLPLAIAPAPAAVASHLALCGGARPTDVHDLLDEMDGICSVGNVQQQQEQLAALLGSILQFAQSVQKTSLKACVVVVTQMLVVLRGDGRNTQVRRDDWAIVQKNLSYMQLATNVALPTEISFAQNSMLNTVCKVFSHLPHCARRKIYKTMFDGMPNFSLRSMSKYLAAHKSTSTGGEL
jgi:hypothetical protein